MWRLKKEAVPFFKEKLATAVRDWDYWEKLGLDEQAIEKVEAPVITYGHAMEKERGYETSWLGGWSGDGKDKGTKFHFTISFPSVTMYENDKFSNGKHVRALMNRIQSEANSWYSEFNTKEENSNG